MDAELEFTIQPNTTGKQLFDQVGFCELEREFLFRKSVLHHHHNLFAKHIPWLAARFSL